MDLMNDALRGFMPEEEDASVHPEQPTPLTVDDPQQRRQLAIFMNEYHQKQQMAYMLQEYKDTLLETRWLLEDALGAKKKARKAKRKLEAKNMKLRKENEKLRKKRKKSMKSDSFKVGRLAEVAVPRLMDLGVVVLKHKLKGGS
jgi:hypothetical protein